MPRKDTVHKKGKLDTSLNERRGIVLLLERLRHESLSLDELEEIGDSLRKLGDKALIPLMRQLWKEKTGNLISRFTYVLEFFENDAWADQLIRIALHRRDLDADAKVAILAALEGSGIDVSTPPLSILLGTAGTPKDLNITNLDLGEPGLVAYIEEFLLSSREARVDIADRLSETADHRVVLILEILLRMQDEDIAVAAVRSLGKVRNPAAADILYRYLHWCPAPQKDLVEKSLRRLSFLNIHPKVTMVPETSLPFHACWATPPDGDGNRCLGISRITSPGRISLLCLQLHESSGIVSASGRSSISDQELERELTDLRNEEGVVAIEPAYALRLLQDALYWNRMSGLELPAEFHVRSGIFSAAELKQVVYEPPGGKNHIVPLVSESFDELFEDDFFSCWFMTDPRVYDYAAQWEDLEQQCAGKARANGFESILGEFCDELMAPEIDRIRRRLMLMADFMRHAGRERWLWEKVEAIAAGLAANKRQLRLHPFLRRYALESMAMARDAMAEGYDIRRHRAFVDDEWDY